VAVQIAHPAQMFAQGPRLAWDEDPGSSVTSFSVSVDGVRTNYGLTPVRSDGSCGCSIPLPFTTGRHTLIVYATNESGETASQPLVNGPTASAGGPYSAQVGVPLNVNAASSQTSGGTIIGYAWNWGDGTTITQSVTPSATHAYAAAGTVTVTVTVTDSFSVTSSASATVTVSGGVPTPGGPADVVVYANDISQSQIHGAWTKLSDGTAAGGVKLASPDNQRPAIASLSAAPVDYVDVVFNATAGTPYTLWLRLLALNNDKFNDSVWVQFSDAQASGANVFPLNSTAGLLVNLATDSSGNSLSRWGWQNGAYWLTQPTTFTFATTGLHTMRLQVREDGVQFDQIVLSPTTYLMEAPGSVTADSTIVPQVTPPPPPPPPPSLGQNLLFAGGFEEYNPPSLGLPGWVSDQPLRQIQAKSERNQPRSGSMNGACWAATNQDCGMYQEVTAQVTGTYHLVFYAAADRAGGLVGANVNGNGVAANSVSASGFGNYIQFVMDFKASAGDTIRVWMYSPATPGFLVIDDVSLTVQ
jgi:PKD repeat protein